MKKAILALVCLVTLSGCGSSPTLRKLTGSKTEVDLIVQKSPNVSQTYKAEVKKNVAEAMTAASIPYKTEQRGEQEVMVELAGVITTMGKAWHLYVNDEAKQFTKLSDITIEPGDELTWQYEAIEP